MRLKTWMALILIIFLGVGAGYLMMGRGIKSAPSRHEMSTVSKTTYTPQKQAKTDSGKARVIGYYLHGDIRCSSCRRIEAFSKEALKKYFSKELSDGRLKIKVVNVENDENQHFIKDYALSFQTVILSRRVNGKEVAWRNLKDVWKYLGDKAAFFKYIKDETTAMLRGGNTS